MEFGSQENYDNDGTNAFLNFMKENTIFDCRIIQLTSHINSLKKELIDITRQIEEERGLSNRLHSEVEIKRSCELQTRNRIRNLDESKRLIAKLCSELSQQVRLEKWRFEETKKLQENSIKTQITKWEDYEKLYITVPIVKEFEKEEMALKAIQIEKMRKEHELNTMKKKLDMRNKIQEKLKEKLAKSDLENAELKKKHALLQNKRLEQLKLIDSIKQEKKEILSELKQQAENIITKCLKRPGELLTTSSSGPLETNFERYDGTEFSPIDLPELPHLQLPQITTSSRKIRRIDMIDTTLVIPDYKSFSFSNRVSKTHSQPVNQIVSNELMVSRNVASVSQKKNTYHSNQWQNEITNQHFNFINKNINRVESFNKDNSFNQHSVPNQCNIVKPLVANENENHFENLENIDSMNETTDAQSDNNLQQEEQMDDGRENNGDNHINTDESQNREDENDIINPESLSNNFNGDGKFDVGYYSQSNTSEILNFASQNQRFVSQNEMFTAQRQNIPSQNSNMMSQSHSSVSQSQNMRSPDQFIQSPAIGGSNRSGYQGEFLTHQLDDLNLGCRQIGSNEGNITRASTALSAMPSSFLSSSVQDSDKIRSKYFVNNDTSSLKSLPPSRPTSQSGMNIFKSPPTPSPSQNLNRTSTITSQNMPSCTKSYLNILSPPPHQSSRGTTISPPEEPPRSINMFGPPSTQNDTGGFNFASTLPTSSIFSMFK